MSKIIKVESCEKCPRPGCEAWRYSAVFPPKLCPLPNDPTPALEARVRELEAEVAYIEPLTTAKIEAEKKWVEWEQKARELEEQLSELEEKAQKEVNILNAALDVAAEWLEDDQREWVHREPDSRDVIKQKLVEEAKRRTG